MTHYDFYLGYKKNYINYYKYIDFIIKHDT